MRKSKGEGLALLSTPSKATCGTAPNPPFPCSWECGCWIVPFSLQAVPHAHFHTFWVCCWLLPRPPSFAYVCDSSLHLWCAGGARCGELWGGGGYPRGWQSEDGSLPPQASVTGEVSAASEALMCDSALTGCLLIHENPPPCAQFMEALSF